MQDLTEYARKIDQSESFEDAQAALIELIDQFQHKDKQILFKKYAAMRKSKASLQKWGWDLVLVGHGMKVIK